MADYKHTLNLPQTDFPMKGNLAQREPEMLAQWQATGLYEKLRAARAGAPNFLQHEGRKPVHWCADCGSALAEAEGEYEDKTSPAIDVRFAVAEEQALFTRCHYVPERAGHGPLSVVIWNTTPWSLPANQAVAVHPELEYVVVQPPTERLVLAEALMKQAMARYGVEDYRVIATCLGADLEGLKLLHPFYARDVSVIIGDHVTTDAGTGAVHTAPGH